MNRHILIAGLYRAFSNSLLWACSRRQPRSDAEVALFCCAMISQPMGGDFPADRVAEARPVDRVLSLPWPVSTSRTPTHVAPDLPDRHRTRTGRSTRRALTRLSRDELLSSSCLSCFVFSARILCRRFRTHKEAFQPSVAPLVRETLQSTKTYHRLPPCACSHPRSQLPAPNDERGKKQARTRNQRR